MSVVDLVPNREWQIIDDDESFWQEDYSIPEREMDQEQSETENRAHTNLRIREWIYDLPSDEIEGQLKKQVDISAAKEMKERNPSFGWIAMDRPLDMSSRNQNLAPPTSINLFVLEWG